MDERYNNLKAMIDRQSATMEDWVDERHEIMLERDNALGMRDKTMTGWTNACNQRDSALAELSKIKADFDCLRQANLKLREELREQRAAVINAYSETKRIW